MILEIREIGRKTPGDGRLEITEASWRRLRMEGSRLRAVVATASAAATLERMACTCGRGGPSGHEHTFVRSDVFRGLVPGETCVLDLGADGTLEVSRPHPLGPGEPGSGGDASA
jgi:hypothetical protein